MTLAPMLAANCVALKPTGLLAGALAALGAGVVAHYAFSRARDERVPSGIVEPA